MYEFKRYVTNLYVVAILVLLERFPTSKPCILMQLEISLYFFPENVYHKNEVGIWDSLDSRKLIAVWLA